MKKILFFLILVFMGLSFNVKADDLVVDSINGNQKEIKAGSLPYNAKQYKSDKNGHKVKHFYRYKDSDDYLVKRENTFISMGYPNLNVVYVSDTEIVPVKRYRHKHREHITEIYDTKPLVNINLSF